MTTPRYPAIKHGTDRGYNKHRRERKGRWGWPACDPCREAKRVKADIHNHEPEVVKNRQFRSRAQHRALTRLKQRYPADFAKFYGEELSFMKGGGRVVIDGLRAEAARLLAGTRRTETELARLVRDRSASLAEREAYWTLQQLKASITRAEQRAQREEGKPR